MAQHRSHYPAPAGAIRELQPHDLPLFRDHLLRLDPVSRRDRFNGVTDDEFVAAYAERCFHDGPTVVAYVEQDAVRGAAELHECLPGHRESAEIAFSVEAHLQHRGIGSRLFERLIARAVALGYHDLRVTTHPQNEAMKALARKFGARLCFERYETVGVIDLAGMAAADEARRAAIRVPAPGRADVHPAGAVGELARAIAELHLATLGVKPGRHARR